jgi:hypothetical protein
MQYGWLDSANPTDFHAGGDVFLRMQKNNTIHISQNATFFFRGFKSSLIQFLRQYPLYTFQSASDHLYIRGARSRRKHGKRWSGRSVRE